MNYDKYLPIGTVVLLKGGIKKAMITGYLVKANELGDKVFDYIGCLFPEGVISPTKNLLFNHEQINKIYYLGYQDDDSKKWLKLIKQESVKYLSNNQD